MLLGVRDVQGLLVEPSTSVLADLRALSQALDERDGHLESLLRDLGASCALAVGSCLGFSITLLVDGSAVGVTLLEEPQDYHPILSSVTIPLAGPLGLAPGSEITLYADQPGAFIDLAADLSYALGLGPGIAQFDRDLTPPARGISLVGLGYAKAHNHAIGILLDQGYDLGEARAELDHLALQTHTTSECAAKRLIDTAIGHRNQEPT